MQVLEYYIVGVKVKEGRLTGSEEIELAVKKLLLRQSGEVILSKRIPAGHVRRGWSRAALRGRGHCVAGWSYHVVLGQALRGRSHTLRGRGNAACAHDWVSRRNRIEVN